MRAFIGKFKERRFMQNLIIEVVADLLMLIMGIIIGYYFKTMLF
ncbi:hypothetical protein NDS46_30925 (plasmid) [Paenibacillus thiaminolyticus]|nr:hypothetical protein [Paenibacillus thiaminolyticus]WCF11760.1 hypothetical protein NDS46_30925 [Paenibacillus thiaminolyticus]